MYSASDTSSLTDQTNVSGIMRREFAIIHPLNQGKIVPHSTLNFRVFVEWYFVPGAFPILKASTGEALPLNFETSPFAGFGDLRLGDIRTLDLQRFVLQRHDSGLGWEVCDHLRNLMSKIFFCAKKWGYFAGDNPASGVELPEKKSAHKKRALMPDQIPQLFTILREPVQTMVLLGILTGLRIGEILGLPKQEIPPAACHG